MHWQGAHLFSPCLLLMRKCKQLLLKPCQGRSVNQRENLSERESCRETQFLLETRIKLLGHFYPERRKMENQSESNTLVEDDYGNPETDEPTGVFKASLFSS